MSVKNRWIKRLFIIIGFIIFVKIYLLSQYIHIDKKFEPTVSKYNDFDINCYCRIDYYGWKTFHQNTPISVSENTNPCKIFIAVNSKNHIVKVELTEISLDYGDIIYEVKQYQLKKQENQEENDHYIDIANIPVPFEDGKIIKVKYKIRVTLKNKVIEKEIEAKFKCIMKIESGFKLFRAV